MYRRSALCLAILFLFSPSASAQPSESTITLGGAALSRVLDDAEELGPLKTVMIAQHGKILAERGYRGNSVTAPTNIKSAVQIHHFRARRHRHRQGHSEGVDQKIAPLLADDLPHDPDPRLAQITIGHLLSMQAGLERTSGAQLRTLGVEPQLGARGPGPALRRRARRANALFHRLHPSALGHSDAAERPLDARTSPATGSARFEDFSIAAWERDPQGIYLGGNQMAMSAKSLLAFGELYRNGGKTAERPATDLARSGSSTPGSRAPIRASPATDMAMAGSCAGSASRTCVMPGAMAGRCSTSCRRSASPSS